MDNGLDFLGYIVRRDYLLVRRRVVNNLRGKLHDYEARLVKEGQGLRRYLFDEAILNQLAATLASYLGHFKLANTYHLCSLLFHRHPFLSQYFDFDTKTCRLVLRRLDLQSKSFAPAPVARSMRPSQTSCKSLAVHCWSVPTRFLPVVGRKSSR